MPAGHLQNKAISQPNLKKTKTTSPNDVNKSPEEGKETNSQKPQETEQKNPTSSDVGSLSARTTLHPAASFSDVRSATSSPRNIDASNKNSIPDTDNIQNLPAEAEVIDRIKQAQVKVAEDKQNLEKTVTEKLTLEEQLKEVLIFFF